MDRTTLDIEKLPVGEAGQNGMVKTELSVQCQTTTRRTRETASKAIAQELINKYGDKAIELSFEEIIDYMLDGAPFPSGKKGPRETTNIRGTTAHQVRKQLDRQAGIRERQLVEKTRIFPSAPTSKSSLNAGTQLTESHVPVDRYCESPDEQQMKIDSPDAVGKIEDTKHKVSNDASQDIVGGDDQSKNDLKKDDELSQGQEHGLLSANPHEAGAVLRNEDPSKDDGVSDNSDNELKEVSARGPESDAGNNFGEDSDNNGGGEDLPKDMECRHEFENSAIQTEIIVQQEATIARLENDVAKFQAQLDPMISLNEEMMQQVAARGETILEVQRSEISARHTLKAAYEKIHKHEVEIVHLQGRLRLAALKENAAEKSSELQARYINILEEAVKKSRNELELSKLALQESQAETARLLPLEGKLQEFKEEITALQSSITSLESSHTAEITSINAKHAAEVQGMKHELDKASKNIEALMKRMNGFVKAKSDEEAVKKQSEYAVDNDESEIVEEAEDDEDLESEEDTENDVSDEDAESDEALEEIFNRKRSSAPGIWLLLVSILYSVGLYFGPPCSSELDFLFDNSISDTRADCPFDYIMPTSSALELPTITSIVVVETTCSIEPGYFGNFYPLSIDPPKDEGEEAAKNQDTEDAGGDGTEDETTPAALTQVEKAILKIAIPVTVVVVAVLCDSWY